MNSCDIKNIIDREELLQRLDLRIRTMSELMATHEKYIISLSVSGNEREKAIRQIDKSHKDFIEAVAKIDNDTKEYFDKLRKEYKDCFGKPHKKSVYKAEKPMHLCSECEIKFNEFWENK